MAKRGCGSVALLLFSAVLYCQTPTVAPGGVLNGASFTLGQPVTPGSLISVFGSNLASAVALADTIPLSTTLGDVRSVTFNNISAPLVFVSPTQINVQLPWEVAASGNATVVVNRTGGSSPPATVQVGPFSPGIFSVQFGVGQAIVFSPQGILAAPVGSIPGLTT
ncbi:MAG: IPT/TIG domain-containing protein, partial [Acidobacteriales bacterium]|nr:IPT/TIG domain-containing protein [Terriglobales bacterium]